MVKLTLQFDDAETLHLWVSAAKRRNMLFKGGKAVLAEGRNAHELLDKTGAVMIIALKEPT
jgi:antibiotic biosynthesis monooxygenase (ABM) superfamily enzyme